MNIDNMNTGTLTIVTGAKTASPTLTRHASINGKYLRCVVTALDPNNSWLTKKKYSATIQIDCKMPPTVTITTAKKYVTESTVGIEFRASAYTANVTTLRYRWYLDGASVGTNSTTYTYIPDTTGTHVIRCEALDQTMASEADGMGYDEMMVYVGKAPAITDLTYETVDYVTTLTPTIQSYDTQNLTYE